MRAIAILALVALGAPCCALATVPAAKARTVSKAIVVDPLFGIAFARTDFESAPALTRLCPMLENGKWRRRMWIFARATRGTDSYFIVGGDYVDRASGRAMHDSVGAFVAIGIRGCRLVGPPRETFDHGDDGIDADLLADLARDATQRYDRAVDDDVTRREHLRRAVEHAPPGSILRSAFGASLKGSAR